MREKAFLGKIFKKLKAKMEAQQNYGGVQQLPTLPIGYDERIQYSEGGQSMYAKKKMMGGGSTKRSAYNKGGYNSVQEMDKMCGSKTVTQKVK